MSQEACMSRKPWDLAFTAEPTEVAALRRILRIHLGIWGLQDIANEAQLCMSELVANVITHVGHGTPATLAVSMSGSHLRIEVHDPDTRALPTLIEAGLDSEAGRGMTLVDGLADRWGVQLHPNRKVTWCELATGLSSATGHCDSPRVTRAEMLLGLYGATQRPQSVAPSKLTTAVAEEVAIDVIADLLHWLRAHGCDTEDTLDRAQMHFEVEVDAGSHSR
ncbi:ATP-binding protein [Streptomyces sp. NPDC048291]|uniref:ATP-binding protein n=1 Tax=Streptomyces sp. NPDC048291 TaxID=3365530 RepID=UPI003715962B